MSWEKVAHSAIVTTERLSVKCCRREEALRLPRVHRLPGTELASSPGAVVHQVADGAAGAQRVEALPGSGRAGTLAQICPTLNPWVLLALLRVL